MRLALLLRASIFRRKDESMNLQLVEQLEKDSILNVLQYAVIKMK